MELDAALRRRRMVRAFAATPIDPKQLDELLDLARRAPSAGNTQAIGFVVLDTPARTERYWNITMKGPKRERFRWQQLLDAPVLVLVTTKPLEYTDRYSQPDKQRTGLGHSTERWPVPYWWVDAGAVVQNLLLLAVDRGLGACLFGPFDYEPDLAAEFDLPPETRIAATIAIGRRLPDEPGRSSGRKRPPVEDVILRP